MQKLVFNTPPAPASSESVCFCKQIDTESYGCVGSYPWTSYGKQEKKKGTRLIK